MDPDLVRQQQEEELSFKAAHNGAQHLHLNGGAAAGGQAAASEQSGVGARGSGDRADRVQDAPSGRQSRPASVWSSAAVTLHALIGCLAGAAAGLVLGVNLAPMPVGIADLVTLLAALFGLTLPAATLMRRENLSLLGALRVIWLGSLIFIGVTAAVANSFETYLLVLFPPIWGRFLAVFGPLAAAIFIAAWAVNHLFLKRELQRRG